MKTTLYSDTHILTGLKQKDRKMIRLLYSLYFESIQRLIIKNSGNAEDAEDIFQDTMVVIYKKITKNELKLTSSLKTYFYAISRNLWLQRLQRKDRNTVEFQDTGEIETDGLNVNEELQNEAKYNLYQKHFLKLSADCQKVLQMFLKKISLKEITEIMGFSSVDYTKTRKYLCKQSLKNSILKDAEYKRLM